jgi:hypothetical protein
MNNGVSNINNNDNVNDSVTDTMNNGVSNINNNGVINERSGNINDNSVSKTNNTTASNYGKIKSTAILSELAKIAEESVRREMIKTPLNIQSEGNMKSTPLNTKKSIENDGKQEIRELFVSPDTNSIDRNDDNGKDTTNTTIIDSISSLPSLPATVSNNNTTKTVSDIDTSPVIDKSHVDGMINDTSNNEFNSDEQDDEKKIKQEEFDNVRSALNKSQVLPVASKLTHDMMNEISKTAINAVMNFMVKNNETNDSPKKIVINDNTSNNEFNSDERKIQLEIDNIRNTRNKTSVYPVEPLEPLHDASITLYDVNYNDTKNNRMIENTLFTINEKDPKNFIVEYL